MDMLVPLYRLRGVEERLSRVSEQGIVVRRPMAHERDVLIDWVRREFESDAPGWVGECAVALSSVPPNCYIATRNAEILGFGCFDVTAKGLFGPTGTAPDARGIGVGAAILVSSLKTMAEAGFAYAVIGGVGEQARPFYEKVVGAVEIAGSEPGIYRDQLF